MFRLSLAPALAGFLTTSALALCPPFALAAETASWTLASTIRRALEVAPEARVADAEIQAREGELQRDSAFPNPTVEARADRRIGIDTGRGGIDVTQLAVMQPLPFSRLSYQRARAEANLAAAQSSRYYQHLRLEHQAALAFHALQLADARHRLAGERVEAAQQYAGAAAGNRTRDRLVRYLSPLDRTRLTILSESARQALTAAEGERREATLRLRQLLVLPAGNPATAVPLANASMLAAALTGDLPLETHPALVTAQHELDAARRGIDVARANRFAAPSVSVFRERDVFGGEERGFFGVAIGVQIPLWNRNQGDVARAAAETNRAEALLAARQRELDTALRESRLRLERLAEQAERYSANVLEPNRRFLDLMRRSFAAGEVGVLALLDANNSYFDAAERYDDLLANAWVAAADLRLAAGASLAGEGGR